MFSSIKSKFRLFIFIFFEKGDGYRGEDPTEDEERDMAADSDRRRQLDSGGQQRGRGGEVNGSKNNNGRRRKNRKKSRTSSRPENSHWNNGADARATLMSKQAGSKVAANETTLTQPLPTIICASEA